MPRSRFPYSRCPSPCKPSRFSSWDPPWAAYLLGPTAGYLLAFPIAAYTTGRLAESGWDRRIPTAIAALASGLVVIYALGFAWLTLFVGPTAAYGTGLAPFILGDLLKILLAATALPAAWRFVRQIRPSEDQ